MLCCDGEVPEKWLWVMFINDLNTFWVGVSPVLRIWVWLRGYDDFDAVLICLMLGQEGSVWLSVVTG